MPDIVNQTLQAVAGPVERAHTEHLAYRRMLVSQLLEAIEIAVQSLLQHGQHQNLPEIHPRPAPAVISSRKDIRLQEFHHLPEHRVLHVQPLQAMENRWNVVT